MKNKFIKVVLLIAVILGSVVSFSSEAKIIDVAPSTDYLIVLVHGVISNKDAFDGIKGLKTFLVNELKLDGYVYAYSFTANRGSIIDEASELGNPNNSQYWIGKAKQEFRTTFPGRPVPNKIILICHSMGGLAARYYTTSDYYQNDVKKLVTLDSPHIGFDLMPYLKKTGFWEMLAKQAYTSGTDAYLKSIEDQVTKGISDRLSEVVKASGTKGPLDFKYGIKTPDEVFVDSTYWVVAGETAGGGLVPTMPNTVLKVAEYFIFSGEGLDQMDPDSSFISNLKTAKLRSGTDQISYRLVSATGAPTPHKDFIKNDLYFYSTPFMSQHLIYTREYGALPSKEQKYWGLLMSMLFPGSFCLKDGSVAVAVDSSRGEGIEEFKKNTKYYNCRFRSEDFERAMRLQEDIYDVCLATYLLTGCSNSPLFQIPVATLTFYSLTSVALDLSKTSYGGTDAALPAHIVISSAVTKKKDGEPSLIEQTLFDSPIVTFSSIHTDINREKYNTTQVIEHTSSIEAVEIKNLAEVTTVGDYYRSVPYMTSEAETYLPYVTVTVPPTQLRGRIYDFKPQMLQRLELSENFAGWQVFKPIEKTPDSAGNLTATAGKFHLVIDQYGYFTLSGFDFYEGQNVVAFKTTNKIGIQTVQHLKVTLNTIPQWPSQFTPLYLTNNAAPAIGCEFNKAGYSSNESERINILSFKIDGVDLPLSDITINKYRNDYAMKTTVSYQPPTPLTEGEHQVMVLANSNIGTSQAIWPFTVDLTGPTISVEAPAQYSPVAANGEPMLIKYQVADQSPFIKNLSFQLYRGAAVDENFVSVITTVPTQAAGESFIKWNGAVPDGEYTLKVKGYDEAGNYTIVTVLIAIDATPPTITDQQIAPNPMTSNSQLLAASCRVDEKASVFFNLRDRGDGVATAFFAGETSGVANYKWDYANKSGNLDDGLYDLEIIARDPAGNESRRTIEAVRIDRTGPVIANALCQPFVLMNSGRDPYSTTLTFNLNENNDQEINRSGTYATKIKLFNQNTGELLQTWDNTDSPLKFNGAAYPKGAYKFQIIATDIYGNNSVSFAMVVKDGMGPTISFPESGPVSGTIAIRGTAMDPDWTNSRPFKGYRVYYKPGQGSWVKGEESQWETALIDVPTVNRAEGGPNFQGIRPLQGDSTLAYLYTNGLANGTYTVLVVVEEEGGESMGAVRTFTVANDPQATMSYLNNPAVRLGPLPNNFNFTGNNKLPINFVNSVKPANVYLEIIRVK